MVMPAMTAPALTVTATQRAELERMAASTTLPHRRVVQAKALLLAADGLANEQIARRCEVGVDTVSIPGPSQACLFGTWSYGFGVAAPRTLVADKPPGQ